MSSKFQDKNKNLVNLEIITADKAWDLSKKRKGKPTLSKKYQFFGRIDSGTSAFVTTTNSVGENHRFVEDTANLPANLKNKVIDMLKNKKKRVVYLVKK